MRHPATKLGLVAVTALVCLPAHAAGNKPLPLPGWQSTLQVLGADKEWAGDEFDPCLVQGFIKHPQTGKTVFVSVDMTQSAIVAGVDPKRKGKGQLMLMGDQRKDSVWFTEVLLGAPTIRGQHPHVCRLKSSGGDSCASPTRWDLPSNQVTAPGVLAFPFPTKAAADYFANNWNDHFKQCRTPQARARVASKRFQATVYRTMTKNAKGQTSGINPTNRCSLYDARWGRGATDAAEFARTRMELTDAAALLATCSGLSGSNRTNCERKARNRTAIDFYCTEVGGRCQSVGQLKSSRQQYNLRVNAPAHVIDGLSQQFALAQTTCKAIDSARTQTCRDSIQGKVLWDGRANRTWAKSTLDRVCRGVESSAEPAQCLTRAFARGGWTWQQAVDLCEGTRDAAATHSCFDRQASRGKDTAIKACDAR